MASRKVRTARVIGTDEATTGVCLGGAPSLDKSIAVRAAEVGPTGTPSAIGD
jgi:hypothetical protein